MSKSQPEQAQATAAMETEGSLAEQCYQSPTGLHMWRTTLYGGSFYQQILLLQITESNKKNPPRI